MYRELEEPLIPVLADIERAGVKIDAAALASLGGRMQSSSTNTSRIYGWPVTRSTSTRRSSWRMCCS